MAQRILIIVIVLILLFAILAACVLGGGILAYLVVRGQTAEPSAPIREIIREVRPVDPAERENGLLVCGVEPGSPADEAGIARGDILLEVNGRILDQQPASLQRLLQGLESGERIEVRLIHGDEIRSPSARVAERNGRPYLGIQACAASGMQEEPFPQIPREVMSGALITDVVPESPADEAGLQAGDRVLAIDGREIELGENLGDIIAGYQPGDEVTLEVRRRAETLQVEVTLGEHPEEEGRAYLGVSYSPLPMQTLPEQDEGAPIPQMPFEGTPGMPEMPWVNPQELPEGVTQGVVLGEVVADSPADRAGLQVGDLIVAVDGEPAGSPQAVVEAIQSKRPRETVLLEIYRPGEEETREVEVTLGEHPEEPGRAYMGVLLTGAIQINPDDETPMPFRFELPEGHPDLDPFEFTFPDSEAYLPFIR